jgi:hypothetical protein
MTLQVLFEFHATSAPDKTTVARPETGTSDSGTSALLAEALQRDT